MTVYNLPQHFNSSVPLKHLSLRVFDSGPSSSQDYNQAAAYVAALTQSDPDHVLIDTRAIHDCRKDVAAIPRRGTLRYLWSELVAWNNLGYGIFANISDMDGSGRYEIANVKSIRCQAVDLDNLSAQQDYERAAQFNPAPSFAVQSSPGKLHIYWQTQQHGHRDRFTLLQRKLVQHFNGDKRVIDPSRVLRLPGFLHLKTPSEPHLVTCWALNGFGKPIDPAMLEIALSGVNVIDSTGERYELGEPKMQAPGWDWCLRALAETNPNDLDRGDWISFTSAWKQAAWNWASEQQLFDAWSQWCARYATNDPEENLKNWRSIRNTEIGWPSLERRNGNLHALRLLGEKLADEHRKSDPLPMPHEQRSIPVPTGELLTDTEQREYFKGCYFVTSRGEILTPDGYMNQTQFNGAFGGKKYVIDALGKTTNKPWEAATNSTLWTIPKIYQTRFLPSRPTGEIVTDQLGRKGINTYVPAIIDAKPGDATPFFEHLCKLFPIEADRRALLDYLAHNVKFPGYKIPWAPLIQSTEGAGKNAFKFLMQHAMGKPYVYQPKAQELIESGSKFNAWQRAKLFIIVDEIRTDTRRDLVEILKPMISEDEIEVQAKGADQELDDNFSNWLFFSNFKDAIPIDKNGRRFAILYSAIQSRDDLLRLGMEDAYFRRFYAWLKDEGGLQAITYWLQRYPIERGKIDMRAPVTSSTSEAINEGRTMLEAIVLQMVRDELDGCRQGWISAAAVKTHWPRDRKAPLDRDIEKTIRNLGFHYRAGADGKPIRKKYGRIRGYLFSLDPLADVEMYASDQDKSLSDGTPVSPPYQPMPGQMNAIALRQPPNG